MPRWVKPYYELKGTDGEKVLIDVTSSAAPGLGPSTVVGETIIPFFTIKGVKKILDFGSGSLRHTFPVPRFRTGCQQMMVFFILMEE